MQQGVDVVYQGALFDGTWLAKPDFLIRIPVTSALGDYAYEIECEEDREAIGNLEFVGLVEQPPTPTGRARKPASRYRFPPQDHGFEEGIVACRKRRRANGEEDGSDKETLPESLYALAQAVAENDLSDVAPYASAVQLLLRARPRFSK
ncbi:MAG: hypothetical protein ACT443_09720 [Gemmatimonadota bacterium]